MTSSFMKKQYHLWPHVNQAFSWINMPENQSCLANFLHLLYQILRKSAWGHTQMDRHDVQVRHYSLFTLQRMPTNCKCEKWENITIMVQMEVSNCQYSIAKMYHMNHELWWLFYTNRTYLQSKLWIHNTNPQICELISNISPSSSS